MGKLLVLGAIALLTLPAISADKKEAREQQWQGTLRTGVVASGGETTGTVVETKAGKFELDLGKDRDLRRQAKKLNGKAVVVTGVLRLKKGVEVKDRRIITVRSLKAAPK